MNSIFTSLLKSSALILFIFHLIPENLLAQKAKNSCNLIADAGPDIENCPGVVFNLKAKLTGKYDEFKWEPPDGLSDPTVINPVANPGQRTVYTLTAMGVSDNLIKNGGFETGTINPSSSGFSKASDFTAMMNNGLTSEYFIANGGQMGSWYSTCRPHSGSYSMVIHGNQNPATPFWCQTITVFPNSEYKIEYWITRSFRKFQPFIPEITMKINGNQVVSGVCGYICRWDKVTAMWNSGASASATICLYNTIVGDLGNSAAIDDISVKECCVAVDSVEVKYVDILADINAPDITCNRTQVTVDASNSTKGPGWTFKWTTVDGKIESGANTTKANVSKAGIYYLEICTPKGCCNKFETLIYGSSDKPPLSISSADTLGCKKTTANINLKSNHQFPLYYDWKGPNGYKSQDQNISVALPGKYYVTITDDYGCSSYDSIRILERLDVPKISISSEALTCIKSETDLVANSTVPNSNFTWKSPDGRTHSGSQWKANIPGWYFVETTTPTGCIKKDSVYIKEDKNIPELNPNATVINCTNPIANLTATCNDAKAQINWTGPNGFNSNNLNTTTTSGGFYQITAISANGCIDTKEVLVSMDTLRPKVDGGNASLTCLINDLPLQPFIQSAYVTLNWTGPNGFTSTDVNPLISQPGVYTIELTSGNGCKNSATINVVADRQTPQLSSKNEHLNCSTPKLNLDLTGDLSGLQFNWTGPNGFTSNQPHPEINASGTYQVSAINSSGCEFKTTIQVTEDFTIPQFSVSNDILTCTKDSVQLILNGNDPSHTLLWTGPGGFSSTQAQPYTKSAGSYNLVVTGTNGCTKAATLTISQDLNKPKIFVNDVTINCKDLQFDLVANSDRDTLTYDWKGPNGFNSLNKTITVNTGGIYTITIVTKDGCKSEQTVAVKTDLNPPNLVLPSGQLNCTLTSLNLDYTSDRNLLSLNWTGPNGFTSSAQQPRINVPGTYVLNVIGENFCAGQQSIVITQDTVRPDITLVADEITCKNAEATLQINSKTAGATISAKDPNGNTFTGNIIKTKVGGLFNVEITAPNTCKNSQTIQILVDIEPPIVSTQNDILNCNKRSLPLQATIGTANTSVKWIGPKNFSSSIINPSISEAGRYTIEVTNNKNGCLTQKDLTVTIDTIKPSGVLGAQDLDCNHDVAEVNSSVRPIQSILKWTDANGIFISDQPKFDVRKGGIFTLQMTDPANGCVQYEQVEVKEDPLRPHNPELAIYQPKCNEKLGNVNILSIQGGHGDFSYSLNNGITYSKSPNFTNLNPGKYVILIKDQLDCKVSVDAEIFTTPFVKTDLIPLIELRLGQSSSLDLIINLPQNAIRSIDWSPKNALSCSDCIKPIANPLVSTDYFVTVIDTNGCEAKAKVRVNVDDPGVWVPNVFSPNGDGINDYAYIFGNNPDVTSIESFQIYNRWGEMVFEDYQFKPNEQNHGWNGLHKSKPMNPAVFVYYAKVKYINGNTLELSGDITLVR